jgi:hypothetical protein
MCMPGPDWLSPYADSMTISISIQMLPETPRAVAPRELAPLVLSEEELNGMT